MQKALGGKGADVVVRGTLDVRLCLVDAGEDDLAHVNACLFADGQLAGAANLDLVDGFGQSAEQERVRLNGEAESDVVAELLAHQRRALVERVEVIDVGRRSELRKDFSEFFVRHNYIFRNKLH